MDRGKFQEIIESIRILEGVTNENLQRHLEPLGNNMLRGAEMRNDILFLIDFKHWKII